MFKKIFFPILVASGLIFASVHASDQEKNPNTMINLFKIKQLAVRILIDDYCCHCQEASEIIEMINEIFSDTIFSSKA
jgi:hypothetical protein